MNFLLNFKVSEISMQFSMCKVTNHSKWEEFQCNFQCGRSPITQSDSKTPHFISIQRSSHAYSTGSKFQPIFMNNELLLLLVTGRQNQLPTGLASSTVLPKQESQVPEANDLEQNHPSQQGGVKILL